MRALVLPNGDIRYPVSETLEDGTILDAFKIATRGSVEWEKWMDLLQRMEAAERGTVEQKAES